ncbi:MAG: NUDIX hydrolase [Bacilli bacterium]|nr:NUDIX hydrolase [Bacilli bacterium]
MRWNLVSVEKETDHRFLNFYVLHYEVGDVDKPRDYCYFLASRREKDALVSVTGDFARPDGVIMLLHYDDPAKGRMVVLTKQFRPALKSFVYSLPAGLMDPSDTSIEETARREALEEVGAVLGEVSMLVPPSPTSEGLSDELDCFVQGEVLRFEGNKLEEFEDISKILVTVPELKEMLQNPGFVFPLPLRCLCLYIMEAWK